MMSQKPGFEEAPGLEELAQRMKHGLSLSRQRLAGEKSPKIEKVALRSPTNVGKLKRFLLFPWFFLKHRFEALLEERVAPLEHLIDQQNSKIMDLEFRLEFLETNTKIQHPELVNRQFSWKNLTD